MLNRYKIFCCGETADDCVGGVLETILPLESGHIHTIKNRKWRCEWVDKNMDGDPIANFRPET
ncbi:MAG: hypothetical protein ACXV8O_01290 [Methylobacter sp.]